MLTVAWLICYPDSTMRPQGSPGRPNRGLTLVFLAIAATNGALNLCNPLQGLKAKYYANADFQPPIASSWNFKTDDYTRIDPQIDFTSAGFSFTQQYFPLYFSNNWHTRSWSASSDNDTNGYLFSGEWYGMVNLPGDITAIEVRASSGRATLIVDGVDYPEGKVSSLYAGPHEIYVRYARESAGPPGLSLQWLENGQWRPVPPYAFSDSARSSVIPRFKFGLFVIWLVALVSLAWRERAVRLRNYRTFLWLVFVCTIARSALELAHNGKSFNFQIFSPGNDWLLYETFAREILQGNWLPGKTPVIFMNFAYRYILAFLHLVGGEAPADAMLLQITSMALLVTIAAGAIAKRWGMAASFVFLVIVLWSKQMMEFAEPLLDTTWAVAAGAFTLYGLIQYAGKASRKWLVVAGLSLGMGILIRANFLPFLGVAALWVLLVGPVKRWHNRVADVAILATLVVGLMSVVALRNQLVAGEWRWLPTSGLSDLWIGNHPPEFDGPTYYVVKWRPERHEILRYVLNYVWSDPLAMARRIFDKSLYILGVEQRSLFKFAVGVDEGFRVKEKVLLPWLIAFVGSVYLWRRPQGIQRKDLILLWAWIIVLNLPLAVLFFPWAYGWRLCGPSFAALYAIAALAVSRWYSAARALSPARHSQY